jgi:hypothetical protein
VLTNVARAYRQRRSDHGQAIQTRQPTRRNSSPKSAIRLSRPPGASTYRSSTSRVDTRPRSIWLTRLLPTPIRSATCAWGQAASGADLGQPPAARLGE